jgi:NAD(P)-dependent dehydrogenase (short-subunit alcohol dehydrogenase family)
MPDKVALVTGASSGIGEAIALKLRELGYTVYGAARRVDRMSGLAERGVHVLELDVTDEAARAAAVSRILTATGRIDVLVNNAGYGCYGALEEVPPEQARAQFEVNVFGAAHLTQLVLPQMRERRSGTIVNISSMGGRAPLPMGGWYHATKFALEALSDCLRMEVSRFGVHVVVIEPGAVRTEWADIATDHVRRVSGSGPYADQAAEIAALFESESARRRASPPSVVADAVAKAVTARRPRTRYVTGFGARPLILLRRVLPDRVYDAAVRLALSRA